MSFGERKDRGPIDWACKIRASVPVTVDLPETPSSRTYVTRGRDFEEIAGPATGSLFQSRTIGSLAKTRRLKEGGRKACGRRSGNAWRASSRGRTSARAWLSWRFSERVSGWARGQLSMEPVSSRSSRSSPRDTST
jgi:hypothetical protein